MNWKQSVKKAKHYLAIEQKQINLWREDDYPWQFVTAVESGSLHRYNTSVSISFKAEHPCGLTFNWSVDMEPREANGSARFQVDVPRLRAIVPLLPKTHRATYAKIISAAAEHVGKQAEEYKQTVVDLTNMRNQMLRILE